jgi:hypothetical protein
MSGLSSSEVESLSRLYFYAHTISTLTFGESRITYTCCRKLINYRDISRLDDHQHWALAAAGPQENEPQRRILCPHVRRHPRVVLREHDE